MQKDIEYLVALNNIQDIGPKRLNQLLEYFKDAKQVFLASYNELIKAGLPNKVAESLVLQRESLNIKKLMQELEQENVNVVSIHDKNYPTLLKEISSPPPLLYYKGMAPAKSEKTLAIVGTRRCSRYGQEVVKKIIPELVRYGITIVSGLAFGIDSIAHKETILARGKTIAVIGSGLAQNVLYPQSNIGLSQQILKHGGTIYSEIPLYMRAQKPFFPQRNRIISGLSHATLVVEAPQRSGALITAYYTLEQNREVLAVPGNIFHTQTVGTHKLIQQGAKLIHTAEDILEAFDIYPETNDSENHTTYTPQTEQEEKILEILSPEPISIDKIKSNTQLTTAQINSILSLLEIRGIIQNWGGGIFSLKK